MTNFFQHDPELFPVTLHYSLPHLFRTSSFSLTLAEVTLKEIWQEKKWHQHSCSGPRAPKLESISSVSPTFGRRLRFLHHSMRLSLRPVILMAMLFHRHSLLGTRKSRPIPVFFVVQNGTPTTRTMLRPVCLRIFL